MVSQSVLYVAVPVSLVVALGLLRRWRSRNWAKCLSKSCLKGKTYLITGANSGIGLETARALVRRKARVIFACRDLPKAKEIAATIREEEKCGEIVPMHLDLSSLQSIDKFVEVVKVGFNKIDCLINNAGVVVPLENDEKTQDGFEIHLGVNHLGHFYLTNLLIDLLKKASPSRVVIVSSTLHEKGKLNFSDLNLRAQIEAAKNGKKDRNNTGYCNSKLMNMYFARGLAAKLKDSGVDVHACCPGFCYTNLFRYFVKWYHYILLAPMALLFMRSAKQGSETVLFCATDYSIEGQSGRFYRDCAAYASKYEFTREEEERLWAASEAMLAARKPLDN